MNGTAACPSDGSRPKNIATSIGTHPYTPARAAIHSASARDELLGVDRRGEDRVVRALELVLDERPEHRRERAREEHGGRDRAGADEVDVVVAADRAHERAEAEPEREQVDRRLDRRREGRRAPVRREVDRPRARARPSSARALEAAERRGRAGARSRRRRRHQSICSPVRSTNTSSRFAGRRSPVGRAAVGAVDRRAPRRSCRCGACGSPPRGGLGLDLGQPRRRAVDLDRLAAGVLGDELGGRPGRDRLAVRHDRARCRRGARPPRCSASTSGSSCPRRAARRSAPTAPGAPAGRARRSARRAARAAAGGRARGRSAAAGACRPRACRPCRRGGR